MEGTRYGDDRLPGIQEETRQKDYKKNIIKDCHDVSDVSQRVTDKDLGNWDGTFTLGIACLHPNPQPRTHDTLHDTSCACPSYSSMGRVHHSIGRSEGNLDIHNDVDRTEGIHAKLHGCLATSSGDVNMEEARYGSDRLHEVQKETILKENILKDYHAE